jgi:serine/threonine protein kinase
MAGDADENGERLKSKLEAEPVVPSVATLGDNIGGTLRNDAHQDTTGNVEDEAFGEVLARIAHAPSCSPLLLVPGHTWGAQARYTVQARIGAGAMGTVYRARDNLLEKTVAIKILRFETSEAESGSMRPRVLREARACAQVEHERVARVYDVDEHDGHAFIVMEFVRGVTLRTFVRTRRLQRFNRVPGVLALAIPIAEGLAALHEAEIIHRDLKPENIMLSDRGIKLLDFGLAYHELVATHRPRRFSGTTAYMSPEQLEGGPLSPRADVFALGVLVYELMTGIRPFAGTRPHDLLRAMGRAPMFSSDDWNAGDDMPHDEQAARLRDVTRRMLSPRAEDRFADGTSVVHALLFAQRGSVGLPPPQLKTTDAVDWTAKRPTSRLAGLTNLKVIWFDDEPAQCSEEISLLESVALTVHLASNFGQVVARIFAAKDAQPQPGRPPIENSDNDVMGRCCMILVDRGDARLLQSASLIAYKLGLPAIVYGAHSGSDQDHDLALMMGAPRCSQAQDLVALIFESVYAHNSHVGLAPRGRYALPSRAASAPLPQSVPPAGDDTSAPPTGVPEPVLLHGADHERDGALLLVAMLISILITFIACAIAWWFFLR